MPLRFVGLSGSLRAASLNTRLLEAYAAAAPPGIAVLRLPLHDVPLYDGDCDDLAGGDGPPPAVAALRAAIADADALLLVGPEHNWSYSAVLKSAIDWCSRPKFASILAGRQVAIGGASPGPGGTARAQEHLRQVLDSVRAEVLAAPEVAVGGGAAEALARGELVPDVRDALCAQLAALRDAALDAGPADRAAAEADQAASAVRSRPASLAA